jgi:hypothetical protein
MSTQRTDTTWRQKIAPAVVAGLVSGTVRAVLAWVLDRLTDPL